MSGWTAHVLEQLADNRLIRPQAKYIGPPVMPWVPIEQRGREGGSHANGLPASAF
jgi:citrate synthase